MFLSGSLNESIKTAFWVSFHFKHFLVWKRLVAKCTHSNNWQKATRSWKQILAAHNKISLCNATTHVQNATNYDYFHNCRGLFDENNVTEKLKTLSTDIVFMIVNFFCVNVLNKELCWLYQVAKSCNTLKMFSDKKDKTTKVYCAYDVYSAKYIYSVLPLNMLSSIYTIDKYRNIFRFSSHNMHYYKIIYFTKWLCVNYFDTWHLCSNNSKW